MLKKTMTALLAMLLSGLTLAQGSAPAESAPPSSPAKKELVARLLVLQRPAVEAMGRTLAEQPAMQFMQQAALALQRLPVERREVLAREIEADLRKYVEEAVPIVRDKALQLSPTTLGPLIEERLDEAELRQVIAALESPAFRKYQGISGDMQRALGTKLLSETRGSIEPKVQALEQTIARRLQPPAAASGAAPAAPAAPGKK